MPKNWKRRLLSGLVAASVTASMSVPSALAADDAPDFGELYTWEDVQAGLAETDEEVDAKVDALLKAMTDEEKFALLGGSGTGSNGEAGSLIGVPRLGVPRSRMYDGPAGVYYLEDTTNPPQEQMVAATWDPEMAYEYGVIHGSENQAIGGNVQLGTQFDITRMPQFGRAKDQFGEDPYLLSDMAVGETQGVQDQGVIAVGKHFAVFSQNATPGTGTNIEISEQAMHELHLPGFEAAVTEGGLLGMMSSYNKINGTAASAHSYLQETVLRQMWNFVGFTVTDWGGNSGFTLDDGTDVEMPSLSNNSQESAQALVDDGTYTQAEMDAMVDEAAGNVLTALGRAGYLYWVEIGADGLAKEDPDPPEVIQLEGRLDELDEIVAENTLRSQKIAEEGGVLLKNEEDVLPVAVDGDDRTVGIIGVGGMDLISGVGGERSYGTISEMTSPYAAMVDLLGEDRVDGAVGIDMVGEPIPAEYLFTADPDAGETETPDVPADEAETVEETAGEAETVEETAGEAETVQETAGETEAPEETAGEAETVEETAGETETVEETAGETETIEETAGETETVEETAGETEAPDEAETVEETADEAETVQVLADEPTEEETGASVVINGVTRTYGTAGSSGESQDQQGQQITVGGVSETQMNGHEIGEFAQIDADIDFTTGTIAGEPNRTYKSENADQGTATAFPYQGEDDPVAYTWTTYIQAPETGTYTMLLEGIGGQMQGVIMTDGLDSIDETVEEPTTVTFGGTSSRQGAQWPDSQVIPTATGMNIGSSATVELEAGKYYKVVVAAVAGYAEKDLQVRLAWITPSMREAQYQQALDVAAAQDVSIVFAYRQATDPADTREETTLRLSEDQEQLILDVAEAAHENGHQVVVVLNNSTAVVMDQWIDQVDGLLEMYFPGQGGGEATANLLTGEVNPGGKLAYAIPAHDEDTLLTYSDEAFDKYEVPDETDEDEGDEGTSGGPGGGFPGGDFPGGDFPGGGFPGGGFPGMGGSPNTTNYDEGILTGYRWYDAMDIEPLYDFGYGLSYTTFGYSGLRVTENATDGDEVGYDVTFTVTNTGDVAGDEVVQLYLGQADMSALPEGIQSAELQLAGYERVKDLQPGESREVTLHVDQRSLSYWNSTLSDDELIEFPDGTKGKWTVAEGERTIYVGSSSDTDDLVLQETVDVSLGGVDEPDEPDVPDEPATSDDHDAENTSTVVSGGSGSSAGSSETPDEPTEPEAPDTDIDDGETPLSPTTFTDVPAGHWASEAIEYVTGQGYFNGTSETTFGPSVPMSRAMLATVLWRMEGQPAPTGANAFT
ncbi:glycoside hydrolase family 3 N-terminal domain-containing protein, partial [uncultured Intestinimonas sp.]|uniref:glycoside hydrolase family 3 N-terminal domain-containing protein n=1 Tax=uncultured Intestinimonas sp. TaxID=1689265 RepID=UPI0025F3B7C6